MGKLIASGIFSGIFVLMGARFLWTSFRNCLQWLQGPPAAIWKRLLVLLPLLALSLTVFGRMFSETPDAFPARETELQQRTARAVSVRQSDTELPSGRSTAIVKRYWIYLEGYDDPLYISEAFRFDPEAFLDWAGQAEAAFRYAYTDGHLLVYEIRRGDEFFLEYAQAYEQQLCAFIRRCFMSLALLLVSVGASCKLAVYLCPPEREARWKHGMFVFAAVPLLVLTFLLWGRTVTPEVSDIPADGYSVLTVELDEGITVALPRGWELGALGDDGMQWYRAESKVSTCFRMIWYTGGAERRDWYHAFLADYRESIQEDFIAEPRGDFFAGYTPSGRRVEGTNYLVSEGFGTSVNGNPNHLLLALLPAEGCAVLIQSSTSALSWEALEAYADQWIWPLLKGIAEPAAEPAAAVDASGGR